MARPLKWSMFSCEYPGIVRCSWPARAAIPERAVTACELAGWHTGLPVPARVGPRRPQFATAATCDSQNHRMITIDGSKGEGGGQVLRTRWRCRSRRARRSRSRTFVRGRPKPGCCVSTSPRGAGRRGGGRARESTATRSGRSGSRSSRAASGRATTRFSGHGRKRHAGAADGAAAAARRAERPSTIALEAGRTIRGRRRSIFSRARSCRS